MALFPSDEDLEQSKDLSIAIEVLEVEGEEDSGKQGVSPQPQPQLTPLAPPLSLAGVSKHEKRQAEIGACNDSNVICRPSDQIKSCEERGVSTTAFTISRVLAIIGVGRLF